jgi:diadenosine tetraphosphate (Ap4A) HIT family hydrolase
VFKLNNKFNKTSYFIKELKLCHVRLHDNSKFPWIMLIPKRARVSQILDLNKKDQIQLLNEIQYCCKKMKQHFKCNNLNVEKVGNIIPQLHIHIIPRHKKDPTWPLPVWVTKPKPYPKKRTRKNII